MEPSKERIVLQANFGPTEGFNFELPDEFVFNVDKIVDERDRDDAYKFGGLSALVTHLPGVQILGYYEGKYPIARFLYYKTNNEGELETIPRIILVTGIYHGEHPGHRGQGEDDYLHGVQINDPSDETGEKLVDVMTSETIPGNTKNFAFKSVYAVGKTVTDARTGHITVQEG